MLHHQKPLIGVKGRVETNIIEKEEKTRKYYKQVIAEKVTYSSSKRPEEK